MTITTTEPPSVPDAAPRRTSRARTLAITIVAVLVLFTGGGFMARSLLGGSDQQAAVPQSSEMESTHGVRFTRLAVVGDGGLLVLSYVVIDAEKAQRLQADRDHPPSLASEAREGGTDRVSLMRTGGHAMRAGSTYYFVYQNTAGAIRAGEQATVSYGGVSLEHLPVL